MLWIIGTERQPEQVVIQRIDLTNGKYMLPKTIRGNIYSAIESVEHYIQDDMPQQIIFDTYGDGMFFKKVLLENLKRKNFIVDEDGTARGYRVIADPMPIPKHMLMDGESGDKYEFWS